MLEWEDERYVCDNCGESGPGWYYNIQMRGWKPLCLCEECADSMKTEQEE